MTLFNYAKKELTLKVVYYGPGLSGKTTNLQHLHSALKADKKGKLISLATETDRTLFFDFLPIDLGKVKDFTIKFQLYTVPGQVRYNATRKVVLKGADAVVFVADSQKAMRETNIDSFSNMQENFILNNIDPDDIPIILQYNKRDLYDILTVNELNSDLNMSDYTYIEAEAVNGKGVQETFQAITKLILKKLSDQKQILFSAPKEQPVEAVIEKTPEEEIIEEQYVEDIPAYGSEKPLILSTRPEFEDNIYEEKKTQKDIEDESQETSKEKQIKDNKQKGIDENEIIKEIYEIEKKSQDSYKMHVSALEETLASQEEKLNLIMEKLKDMSQVLISTRLAVKNIADQLKDSTTKKLAVNPADLSEEIPPDKKKRNRFWSK